MTLTSMANACDALDSGKPCARRADWPRIAHLFARGFDTFKIAYFTGLSEAQVANALHHMREEGRK